MAWSPWEETKDFVNRGVEKTKDLGESIDPTNPGSKLRNLLHESTASIDETLQDIDMTNPENRDKVKEELQRGLSELDPTLESSALRQHPYVRAMEKIDITNPNSKLSNWIDEKLDDLGFPNDYDGFERSDSPTGDRKKDFKKAAEKWVTEWYPDNTNELIEHIRFLGKVWGLYSKNRFETGDFGDAYDEFFKALNEELKGNYVKNIIKKKKDLQEGLNFFQKSWNWIRGEGVEVSNEFAAGKINETKNIANKAIKAIQEQVKDEGTAWTDQWSKDVASGLTVAGLAVGAAALGAPPQIGSKIGQIGNTFIEGARMKNLKERFKDLNIGDTFENFEGGLTVATEKLNEFVSNSFRKDLGKLLGLNKKE